MQVKFYYIKALEGETRYFRCTYCNTFQIDDGGNYLCWVCEDGKLKRIPKWRRRKFNPKEEEIQKIAYKYE